MKRTLLMVAAAFVVVAVWGGVAAAGEYHVSNTLICYDCHTMHFSMAHGWDGGTVASVPTPGGSWLGSGPNHYLLKNPANTLCLECHDGQTFAPDVVETNTNPVYVREAGALNNGGGTPYEDWKGHTLDSTATPPGGSPLSGGLECTNCHTQHGRAGVYRNLGPRSGVPQVIYQISTSQPGTSVDVWINLASYTAGSGNAATFGPYYDQANIRFLRNENPAYNSSNNIVAQCAYCHSNFHGAVGGAEIGGTGTPPEEFIRHPSSGVDIGGLGGGGHSALTRYTAATNKVKVATNDYTGYTNSSPICVSCHKAHGNQNPFGLIFMSRTTGTISEEGTTPAAATLADGVRNLCGQCHGQGN